MVPFPALREAYRIPWIRDNRDAIRFLMSVFDLLLALHRLGRRRDFLWVSRMYFEMTHSFAQYGRSDARGTIEELMTIPWFAARRWDVLRLVSAHNQVVALLEPVGAVPAPEKARAEALRLATGRFVAAMKAIVDFGESDERRVRALLDDPARLEEALASFRLATA